jgi:hypothetical protein
MCIFCAAVPAAVSLGAAAHAKQKQTERAPSPQAEKRAAWVRSVPASQATAVVVAGLVTASVIYHAQLGPA